MIEFKHVNYVVAQQPILKDLNFKIASGERVAFIGPSGAGKTTLLQLMNGVDQYFEAASISGEVILDGRPMTQIAPNEISRLVGNVFQDPRNQFFAKNVSDEIYLRLGNYNLTSEQVSQRYQATIARFGLEKWLQSPLSDLSSGQKQTVAFALATAPNPKLVILDEPAANLDLPEIRHMQQELRQFSPETTLIISEHHLFYLMGVIDRFIYLDHGQIKGDYTSEQLKAMSGEERTALGLRSLTLLPEKTVEKSCCEVAQPLLTTTNLTFGYQRRHPLLQQLNLEIARAGSWGLIGRNGIGKSTLAKLLSGLARPQHGKICLNQHHAWCHTLRHENWYVMQQTVYQLFTDSVWHELFLNLRMTPARCQEADQLLIALGLKPYRERHPATLSGGQKQRLVLAVALLHHPKFLILDEPSSGLDQRNLTRVIACLNRYQQRFGMTLLTISHDPEFLYQTCDHYLVLKHQGALNVLKQKPAYPAFVHLFD